MVAWLPIFKMVLPHVAGIAASALPAFTSKKSAEQVADPLVSQQIEELQTAVTANAESIHVLAEKLQQTIEGLDEGSAKMQRELAMLRSLIWALAFIAAGAVGFAVWTLWVV